MTPHPKKTTPNPTPNPAHRPTALALAEPDLVDRIFEYIFSDPVLAAAVKQHAKARPGNDAANVDHIKTAVRAEFRGEMFYVASRPETERQRIVAQTLSLFNGRNATEVARRLGIGRTTVYRYLKQAGSGKA